MNAHAHVLALSRSAEHAFSKQSAQQLTLIAGLGVEGDAHRGVTVKHRSRVARNPAQPNLRQVHLIHAELHEELRGKGFTISPGQMGENITTRRINLLALPTGTHLHIGSTVVIQITGLRNPCAQLDKFMPGLMAAVLDRDDQGNLIRKAGVMATVICGGVLSPHDSIRVELPADPHQPLLPV